MAFYNASRSRLKNAAFRQVLSLFALVLFAILFLVFLLRDRNHHPSPYSLVEIEEEEEEEEEESISFLYELTVV